MTGKEPGLDKLITQGRVGEVPHTPPVEEWEDFEAILSELVESDHDYEMIGVDSLSDVVDMAKEYVIRTDYGGDGTKYSWARWSSSSFASSERSHRLAWRLLVECSR